MVIMIKTAGVLYWNEKNEAFQVSVLKGEGGTVITDDKFQMLKKKRS